MINKNLCMVSVREVNDVGFKEPLKFKMIKITLVVLVSLFCKVLTAQYTVSAFQGEYEEIEDYNSIARETLGHLYWAKKLELPFTFPYFDTSFNKIEIGHEGMGFLENEIDYSLRLMAFGYISDKVTDPNNIPSDVRYKYGVKDGKYYLVVQFTKNRLMSDTSVEEHDSHVNFQYWLYDDGTIELRFGPSDLSNSPVYVPGKGFYLITNQGPIPAGPQLALYHPYDESIRLEYNDLDSYKAYELNDDGTGSVNWWPPDGWVIKFTNDIVSVEENNVSSSCAIFPNPTTQNVVIDTEENVKNIKIFNSSGAHISSTTNRVVDLSSLKSGIYYISVLTDQSLSNHRILKL